MRKEGDYQAVLDSKGFRRVAAIGGWMKRWNHWVGRGVLGTEPLGPLEMPFVRCTEERAYVDELVGLFRDRRYEDVSEVIEDMYYCAFPYPFSTLEVVNNRNYLAQ